MESKEKCVRASVCVLGTVNKEQRRRRDIGKFVHLCAHLSVLMSVGLSVCESNEGQPGQKGY